MPRQYITCSSCHQIALRVGRGLCRACYNAAWQAGTLPPKPDKAPKPQLPKRPKHMERIARTCGGCGATIMLTFSDSKKSRVAYCSPECRSRKVDHTCPGCGIVFATTPGRLRQAGEVFCSKECWQRTCRRRNFAMVRCATCRVFYFVAKKEIRRGRGKFCSPTCHLLSLPPGCNARKRPKHEGWRSQVLHRDNHTCQRCGAAEHLQAHHIKPWAKYPDLRYDLENGITLCRSCHRLAHKKVFLSGIPI